MVDAPALEKCRVRVLNNLIYLKMAMGLDWVAFKGPFQHKLLFDPMIQILLWLKYLWFAFGKKSVTLSAKSPADTVSNASGDLSL